MTGVAYTRDGGVLSVNMTASAGLVHTRRARAMRSRTGPDPDVGEVDGSRNAAWREASRRSQGAVPLSLQLGLSARYVGIR